MSTRYAIHLGESMSMEEFIEYAKNKSLTQKQVEDIEVSNNEFGDAPPCLETLVASGFPPGSMNNGLFNMGVYARMKFGDDWQKYVFAYNERFMGPGASHEVQQLIKSLDKKKYTYKCHEAPICGVCDKSSCSGREFGPMGEHSPYKSPENKRKFRPCVLDEVDQPIIRFDPPEESDDEPFYVFNIKGKRMTATLEMISHQGKFLHGYLKKFHKVMAAIEVDRWNTKMNELLDGADVKAMAIDGGPEGQFMIYLESFCTKIEARSKDELLQGKPWNDNGKTYFRLMDLMKYLDINRFKTFSQTQLCDILRRRGADHHKFMIKGKCVACWSIEQFKTQTEDFDIPNVSNSAY